MKHIVPVDILKQIQSHLSQLNQNLCVIESCTGGLLSFWLSYLAHSSRYFKGALVPYSTDIKIKKLGLSKKTLQKQGLVTQDCAKHLAESGKTFFCSDWAISLTGIAGPAQGDLGESVGTVAFAVCSSNMTSSVTKLFKSNNRNDIRYQAALFALEFLLIKLESKLIN